MSTIVNRLVYQFSGIPPARNQHGQALETINNGLYIVGGLGAGGEVGDTWKFSGQAWSSFVAGTPPSAGYNPGFAFFGASGLFVYFGGRTSGGSFSNSTYTLDPTTDTWAQVITSSQTALDGVNLVYEEHTGRLIRMFGGGVGTETNVVKEFTGSDWVLATTGTVPTRRYAAAWYDPTDDVIYVFGGLRSGVALGDLYRLKNDVWSVVAVNPLSVPSPRYSAQVAYFPELGAAVLHGGIDSSGNVLSDTWLVDGSGFTQVVTSQNPTDGRGRGQMSYDPIGKRLLLFAGETTTAAQVDDLWEYTTSEWSEVNPQSFVFDSTKIQMAGGASLIAPAAVDNPTIVDLPGIRISELSGFRDTSTVPSRSWFDLLGATPPAPRYFNRLAYDPVRKVIVSFGGSDNGGSDLSDTAELSGVSWSAKSPATVPPGRELHGLWYDENLSAVTLFGGQNVAGTTFFNDVYYWDGTNWNLVSISSPPSGRARFAVAYDTKRKLAYIICGIDQTGTELREIWAFNGSSFTQVSLDVADPLIGLSNLEAEYDPVRDKVVIFGGLKAGGTPVNSVWEFDPDTGATTLLDLSASPEPDPRYWHHMTWHPDLDAIVMWGGFDNLLSTVDTWLFDGVWTEVIVSNGIDGENSGGRAYYAPDRRIVQFGGFSDTTFAEVDLTHGYDGSLVRYTQLVDSVEKYHDGSSWVDSDGTYEQTNSDDEVNDNALSLDLSTAERFQTVAYLHSPLNTEPGPVLSEVERDIELTLPKHCLVFGESEDIREGTVVRAIYPTPGFFHGQQFIPSGFIYRTTVDANGDWQLSLPETQTVQKEVTIEYLVMVGGTLTKKTFSAVTIPNVDTAEISTLN